MKTYLVTGGAGFIGSTLCENILKNGDKAIVIDNFCDYYDPKIKRKNIECFENSESFKLYEADIRDKKAVKKIMDENMIDIVIHLAAMAGVRESIKKSYLYQEVNILGTQNILDEMKEHNITKGVFASSSSVYGNCKRVPFNENERVDFAISPYAATKKSNEVMCHVYHKIYNFDIVITRFFSVYGPRQRPDLAISKFTKAILNNKPITMFGDGSSKRDYTYIDDIVDGILKSCDYVTKNEEVYEIINLGNSSPISLNEMVKTISNTIGKEPIIEKVGMQNGDPEITYADITKAQQLLNYQPKVSFKEGIEKYIKWYQ